MKYHDANMSVCTCTGWPHIGAPYGGLAPLKENEADFEFQHTCIADVKKYRYWQFSCIGGRIFGRLWFKQGMIGSESLVT